VTDETCVKLMDLYMSHQEQSSLVLVETGAGPEAEAGVSVGVMLYQHRAEQLLNDDNCFRLTMVSTHLSFVDSQSNINTSHIYYCNIKLKLS